MALVGVGRHRSGLTIGQSDPGNRLVDVDVCDLVLVVGRLDRGLDSHGRVALFIALADMQRVPRSVPSFTLVLTRSCILKGMENEEPN